MTTKVSKDVRSVYFNCVRSSDRGSCVSICQCVLMIFIQYCLAFHHGHTFARTMCSKRKNTQPSSVTGPWPTIFFFKNMDNIDSDDTWLVWFYIPIPTVKLLTLWTLDLTKEWFRYLPCDLTPLDYFLYLSRSLNDWCLRNRDRASYSLDRPGFARKSGFFFMDNKKDETYLATYFGI